MPLIIGPDVLFGGVTPGVHNCGFFIVVWGCFISQVYGASAGCTIQSSLYFGLNDDKFEIFVGL